MSQIYLEHSHHPDDAAMLIDTYIEASRQKYPKHFGTLFQQQLDKPFFCMDEAAKLDTTMRRVEDHHLITAYLDDSKQDIVGFVSSRIKPNLRHDVHEVGMLCSVAKMGTRDLRHERLDARLFSAALSYTPQDVRVVVAPAHVENKAFFENCGMMYAHTPKCRSLGIEPRFAHRDIFGVQGDLMAMVKAGGKRPRRAPF